MLLQRPEWLVTHPDAVDTELGILKTGKEADVHLVERAYGDESCLLAAKRYRRPELSDFHRSAIYTEGRRIRKSRETRALANHTQFGRQLAAGQWAVAEWQALTTLSAQGVAVPYPVELNGLELLMEFIGDDGESAPRLAAAEGDSLTFAGYFEQVVDIMRHLAEGGWAHGDLSAYNLLVHEGRVVVIDLPQIVDVAVNPNGVDLLARDCRNICTWFARKGVVTDPEALLGDLLARLY